MIFDKQSLFSDAQAITVPAVSTNVLDVGAMGIPQHADAAYAKDLGKGRKVPIRIQIVEDFAGAFTNLEVSIQTDSTDAFGSAKTVMTHSVAKAAAVAGYVIPFDFFPRGTDEQFVRLNYNLTGTATASAGKITAGVTHGNDEQWV
ncbi:major capsid protein [Microcystis phage Mel-JY33]